MFRLCNLLSSVSSIALLAAAGDPPAAAGDPPAEGAAAPAAAGTAGDPPAADGSDGSAAGGEGDGEPAAGEGDPPEPAAPPAPDWRDRELGRKHAQLQEQKRRNAQIEQELADAKALLERGGQAPAAGDPPARAAAPSADDPAVQRAAQTIVAKNEYDAQCNDAFAKGKEAFKDKWEPALSRIQVLGGLGDGAEGVEVMTGILATDDPAKVLFELGSDIEKATEFMAMTPLRRAIAMAKIADTKVAPRAQSKAPAPVDPIGGRGGGDDKPSDRDTDEEWNRKEAVRERKRAEQRRAQGY